MNFETLVVKALLAVIDQLLYGNQMQRLERARADLMGAMEVRDDA